MKRAAIAVVASAAAVATAVAATGALAGRRAELVLPAGRHAGFTVREPVTVRAMPGAIVEGEVRVEADGVRLDGLTIVGGDNAVTVEGVDGVEIENLTVRSAAYHGVEISDGSAEIRGCSIRGLGPYGQGIEVRNSTGRPRTVVEGCSVHGGLAGLVSHVSRIEFRDNRISGTTQRAIDVTEMSEGIVERNVVSGVTGIGIWCGDMSHCEVRRNVVRSVRGDGSTVRTQQGYGAVAFFHATMRLRGNRFESTGAGPVGVFVGSTLTDRFPPALWPPGWRAALPAFALVTLAALAGLVLVAALAAPVLRRRRGRAPGVPRRVAVAALITVAAVQGFHMLEHGVQAFQVFVAHAEVRQGLIGAHVNTEWAHLGLNAAVFGLLVLAWPALRSSRGAGAAVGVAAVAVQAYHVVEHVAKIAQHVSSGVHPAPGLLGGRLGLVWFHYAVNVAVTAGIAAALAARAGRVEIWRTSTSNRDAESYATAT